MKRNIRPIQLQMTPEEFRSVIGTATGSLRQSMIDRHINPPVTFTKEGEIENRIRELRHMRQLRMLANRQKPPASG